MINGEERLGFRTFNNDMDFVKMSDEILEMWDTKDVFTQTLQSHTARGELRLEYVFYEGPPSANGPPGIHHVMARTLKDVFCRYKTLQGYRVPRVAGWDTHGLPVELGVEKQLGILKEDIGSQLSVEEFNTACLEAVSRHLGDWEKLTRSMGYWVQMANPYKTCSPQYMESVWWLVAEIHRRGYLYRGYSIQPYSPGAGTALSSHELNQPGCYRMVKDLSCVVQFVLEDSKGFLQKIGCDGGHLSYPVSLLAWTTTPWTLPAHCALCVHQQVTYLVVGTWQKYTRQRILVILAQSSLDRYFGESGLLEGYEMTGEFCDHDSSQYDHRYFKIYGKCLGQDLIGLSYEPPFDCVNEEEHQTEGLFYRVIADDFVSTDEGTGIVHLAPCYGADDYRVCQQHGIGSQDIVSVEGRYYDDIKHYGGRYIKPEYDNKALCDSESKVPNLDVDLTVDLKKRGLAFRVFKIEHSYPHCWRSDVPIFYRPVESWFIQTTAIADKLVQLNQTIHWFPPQTGIARFSDWLKNLVDWNLSRSRYWGTPLPIWTTVTDDPGELEHKVIGSIAELDQEICRSIELGLMDENPWKDQKISQRDLHRSICDQIILADRQGRPMRRENDVCDVWFDSGAMPYAAIHYPFSDQPLRFPADFIAEGVDQTRGWFFSLHVIAALCFDSVAYKNVLASGLVLDKHGRKMSKRLGNTIDPFGIIEKWGADIVRWYMLSNAKPWENLKFDEGGLKECSQKFFHTLFQVYQFFAVYANIDGFKPSLFDFDHIESGIQDGRLALETFDYWLISELHNLVADVRSSFDQFDPTTATRQIQLFTIDKLSNWYVRLSRRRFWKAGDRQSKEAGYATLWYVLMSLSKLAAPAAPMLSDWLFRSLCRDEDHSQHSPTYLDSVHCDAFPCYREDLIQAHLVKNMADVRRITSLILSLREKASLRVRQPLKCVYLVDFKSDQHSLLSELGELVRLIEHETNIKSVQKIDPADPMLTRRVKPNYSRLGSRLGSDMKSVAAYLKDLTADEISCLQKPDGVLDIPVDHTRSIQLYSEDVIITYDSHAHLLMGSDGVMTLALNTHIDEDLKQEGLIRELVSRVQNIRKSQGLEITQRIAITISAEESLKLALESRKQGFMDETLCEDLTMVSMDEVPHPHTQLQLDDIAVVVSVQVR